MLELKLDSITDPDVKEALQRIKEEFKSQALLQIEWRFIELTFMHDLSNFLYPHRLGFQPKDIIQTGKTGTGSITYNQGSFTTENLSLTTSGTSTSDPLVVRFFVGRYEEGSIV